MKKEKETDNMKTEGIQMWQIESQAGIILGTYPGEDREEAIYAMCMDAGSEYQDDSLIVEEAESSQILHKGQTPALGTAFAGLSLVQMTEACTALISIGVDFSVSRHDDPQKPWFLHVALEDAWRLLKVLEFMGVGE